jgi:hypothetical protein
VHRVVIAGAEGKRVGSGGHEDMGVMDRIFA